MLQFILVFAQDYEITFVGSGASNTVDSILVENLTQGTSIKMSGTDTLMLTKMTTGINSINRDSNFPLLIYPNPFTKRCQLEFSTLKSENITIQIYDLSGKLNTSKVEYVEPGNHYFQINGIPQGMYIVRLRSASFFQSAKIFSFNQNSGEAEIIYQGYSPEPKTELIEKSGRALYKFLPYYNDDNILLWGWGGNKFVVSRGFSMTKEPEIEENNVFTFKFTPCSDKNGNSYTTCEIGDQIWMAENFSCETDFGSWAFDNDENNVATYGRLYTWEAAMENAPDGWHLPSVDEWVQLQEFLEGNSNDNLVSALKKDSGWLPGENGNSGNGTNASGFAAIPGGARWFLNGTFYGVGTSSYFWTGTESEPTRAHMRKLTSDNNEMGMGNSIKDYGFSVRYIKDKVTYGSITDTRDGQTYKTIEIGTQTWMAENLKYTGTIPGIAWKPTTDDKEWAEKGPHSGDAYCWYDNDESYKDLYGALYNWYAAGYVDLCPSGWHVPSDLEWETLSDFLIDNGYGYQGSGIDISKALAATTNWDYCFSPGDTGNDPASNNSSGFSGLPAGHRSFLGGYSLEGNGGYWWSRTQYDSGLYAIQDAWTRQLKYQSNYFMRNWGGYNNGFSVRCIKD